MAHISEEKIKIAVIGLGYVGLPLAAEFARLYSVTGFDHSGSRVKELRQGHDRTLELSDQQLTDVKNRLKFSDQLNDIASCNVYIVTVPTPIDKNKHPDLEPLLNATRSVAGVLKKGDIVIYESTVYPGTTEEECVPLLESLSRLKYNEDFFCGYSPERVNPGDKVHTVATIKKVTSGSTPEVALKVDALYCSIITAGTHLAPNIKVAEAAKVIENSQRDVNIAFVNELALIFNKMGINTNDVLEAAGTKWNFLPFKPGLVGGHCIGVDPYYLTHKAQEMGYTPEILLSGRRLNDNMGIYVANQVMKLMIKRHIQVEGARVLVLGISFKENCPDIRNSKVVDVIRELQDFACDVDVYDPWADPLEVLEEYGISLKGDVNLKKLQGYSAIVLAVAHREFKNLNISKSADCVVYDVKSFLPWADAVL